MKKSILFTLLAATLVPAFLQAETITSSINPGPQFAKRAPQIALWIEKENGEFVATLFVTKKAAANKWISSPKDGRPESLPDWYNSKGQNPSAKISKDEIDATASATPKKGTVTKSEIALEKGTSYIIKCQVNQSFDYNEHYTKENSGVDGQPAVLYSGKIIPDGTEKEIKLELTGKDEFITTADKILSDIYVVVK